MLTQFLNWLARIFSVGPAPENKQTIRKKPKLFFHEIVVDSKTPRNDAVELNTFYLVVKNNNPKWAMFSCPCGCGYVITLSLQKTHDPYWRLTTTKKGRPTLHPSVWQKTECYSHFWVRDGVVYWCEGTGSPSEFW